MADRYFRHEEYRRADGHAEWLALTAIIGVATLLIVVAFGLSLL